MLENKSNNIINNKLTIIAGTIFFLTGFFSTLEIFKYKVGPVKVYPADIFFFLSYLLIIINLIFSKDTIKIIFQSKEVLLLHLLFFMYFFVSLNFIVPAFDGASEEYVSKSLKYFIKMILLFGFIISMLFSSFRIQKLFIKFFITGFFISIVLHAVYSLVMMIVWYITYQSLNVIILNSIGITEESVGHTLTNFVLWPILRNSGLHWDPAYFGLWGILGIFFTFIFIRKSKTKLLLVGIIGFAWFFTFSKTGYFNVCVTISFLILLKLLKFSAVDQIFTKQNNKVSFTILIFFILSLIPLIGWASQNKLPSINDVVKYQSGAAGNKRHFYYPIYALDAITVDPIHFMFGYGSRNSGRSFVSADVEIPGWSRDEMVGRSFDIETDIFKNLINLGFGGFIIFLFFNLSLFKVLITSQLAPSLSKYKLFLFITVFMTFVAGTFYVFIDSRWIWFFYLISLMVLNVNEKGERNAIS